MAKVHAVLLWAVIAYLWAFVCYRGKEWSRKRRENKASHKQQRDDQRVIRFGRD